jgi:hypothetical protein
LNKGNNGNHVTNENGFWNINALENEGQKIRYKVVLSLYTLKTIKLKQYDFQHVPLELMPRLIELVQQEMGYGKYGRGIWKAPIRAKGSNPRLTRVYEVVHGWSMMPSLFAVSYYHHSYVCHHFVTMSYHRGFLIISLLCITSSINREALVRKRRRLPRSVSMLLLSMKLTTKSGPQGADTERA